MATLASRDTTGTFAVRKREGELRECVEKRTRAFKVFALPPAPDGRERFRVGGQIGPVHYRLDPDREGEDWKEIDLALVPTTSGVWDFACTTNGYQVYVANRLRLSGQAMLYAAQFRRLGSWLRMAPVALLWENAAGERQVIGRPRPGIEPVIDNEADTCTWPDCFGPGLDYAYNLRPDHFYKTVTVRDAKSLPAPTIGAEGLRLTVVLALAWSRDAGPQGFAEGRRVEALDPAADFTARPDEERVDPGLYPHRRAGDGRDAFWVRVPEAWDSWEPGEDDKPEEAGVHRWPLSKRLRRWGGQVFGLLSLDAKALRRAVFPVMMDDDIAEEQVGASSDDAMAYTDTSAWRLADVTIYWNNGTNDYYWGSRFTTVPIPAGATIDSASIQVYIYLTAYDDPYYTLYGNDVADAATFSDGGADTPDSRAKTTATATDSQIGVGVGWYKTPDLADIVTEIVGNVGWASGNAMAFLDYPILTAGPQMRVYSYDHGTGTAAKFNCSYTAAAAGVPMREFMRGIRERHGQTRYGRFF